MIQSTRLTILLTLVLVFMSTMTVGATSLVPSFVKTELSGDSPTATTDLYDAQVGKLKAQVANSKDSVENLEYRIYRFVPASFSYFKLVASGEVGAGQTKEEYIDVTSPGYYYISIDCHIPPNVRYATPPCQGSATLGWF